jgi:acyl-CoA thioester hydrolase
MPRTKLTEQPHYEFCYPITLQPRDINYGGHMGVDALISIIGTARAYIFKSAGLSEINLGDDRTGIIMTDFVVNLKAEGFMFDNLEVHSNIGELTKNGFRFFHKVTRGDSVIALVETGFLAYDYVDEKIAAVQETFMNALGLSRGPRVSSE